MISIPSSTKLMLDRYHELLFIIDTCQANTMYSKFYSPNVIGVGSSKIDTSSYSHHADSDVGVAVIDRFTYYNLEFLESQVHDQSSKLTLGDLFDSYDEEKIHSAPGFRYDLFNGGESAGRNRLVMDFFGNVQNVETGDREQANATSWKDDLAALQRLVGSMSQSNASLHPLHLREPVAELRNDVADTSAQIDEAPSGFATDMNFRKQALGATVVLGVLGAWFAGSLVTSKA